MYIEQSDLSLTLSSPLGPNVLIVEHLKMIETISVPFVIELQMHSTKHDISFDDIIGQDIQLTFNYQNEIRYFSGTVGEFSQGPTVDTSVTGNNLQLTRYFAKLYPKFWLLKFSQDHQIFQEKSAMQIISSVLNDNSVLKKEDKTSNCGQQIREYCVQYRESYFDFVSRLMQEEGIFYYFDHSQTGEKMIINDDSSSAIRAYAQLPMMPAVVKTPYFNQIQDLTYARQVVSKKFQTADYNFETASTKLYSITEGDGKGLAVYRYPGYYPSNEIGDGFATHRIQELEWRKEMISGTSTAPLLTPMQSFSVTDHPRNDLNTDFVIYQVTHEINMFPEHNAPIYRNTFQAFPATVIFRPPITTQKPTISSTQTAKVTGKIGEEIWCDEYGRIKVKFHWDQKGTDDEKSSCWIRVAQLWASSGWGGLWTPRVGMEVVVTFLEGDPDRPLVTGCVYNSDNIPPYAQNEPTKSTIRSNTTKGGNGFNEIRFEDKAEAEEIFIHAQKDMNTIVEDNRTLLINDENDTTDIMCGNRTVTLHANDGTKMKNGGNDTLTLVKGNRLVDLQGAGPEQGNHTLTLTKGDNTITITKGNMSTTLAAGNQAINVTGNRTLDITEAEDHTIGGNYTLTIGGNLTISASGNISLEAGGNVSIKGTEISLTASAGGKFDGGPTLDLTASGQAKLNGGGQTQIIGGIVQIN